MPESGWKLAAPPKKLTWALLILVLLVALFLRTHDLARVPVGPYYDEAAAQLLASDVAAGRSLPVFITSYTGHEVLFYYLAAVVMRLAGMTLLALRLTSALVGVLTVLVTYVLARELFADDALIESHWLGLFAAALMATSFWHVSISRYGFRAITLPLVQALMLLALWRGVRLGSWRWMATAGVSCGLVAYTYLSSRIVPVALALLLLLMLLAERKQWRLRLAQMALMALVALIVFAPLGLFFIQHPETLGTRTEQVSIFYAGSDWKTAVIQNTLRALQVFTVRGDPDLRLNLPGQPMFSNGPQVLFYFGLAAAILSMVARPRDSLRRVRYALIIFWPLVMLIPTILSDPAQVPHSLRAIGVMPLAFLIPAIGVILPLSGIKSLGRLRQENLKWLASGLLILVLGLCAWATFQNYFARWSAQPKLYLTNDGDLADLSRYLDLQPDDGRTLYVSAPDYRHPTVAATAGSYHRLKWVQGGEAFVFAPGPARYAWSHLTLPDDWWLALFFPLQSRVASKNAPDGTLAYVVHTLDQLPVISPMYPLRANFGNVIQAIGYDVLRDRPSGGRTDVAVYWRILRKPDRGDYSEFITLRDDQGMMYGEGGSFAYPSEQWAPGEILAERVRVQTEDGAPPGDFYTITLGWWSASAQERLPILDAEGKFAGTTITLSPITLTRRIRPLDVSTLNISHRLSADYGGLHLLGFDQWPPLVRQGETEFATLYWQAASAPLPNRTVTVQMRGADGSLRSLARNGPVRGQYPTSQWDKDEFIADKLALRIPPDTPPGSYTLEAQVDDFPVQPLGTFQVQAIPRQWTQPATTHPLSVTLGSQVALVGYDAAVQTSNGQRQVAVTLHWQALREMDKNYVVFVHLVDSTGLIRAQQDLAPVNGTYATSLWRPGEFVTDAHTLELAPDLPDGTYALQVGLYLAENGARLSIGDKQDSIMLERLDLRR